MKSILKMIGKDLLLVSRTLAFYTIYLRIVKRRMSKSVIIDRINPGFDKLLMRCIKKDSRSNCFGVSLSLSKAGLLKFRVFDKLLMTCIKKHFRSNYFGVSLSLSKVGL